jgi:uncharacterized protein
MSTAVYVDTSALAKYYLQESGSADFEGFIRSDVIPQVSRLVLVEFRCLVARRARAGMIGAQAQSRILTIFFAHLAQGLWRVEPLDDGDLVEAGDLIDRLREHPLRTLDAIHLAAAKRSGAPQLATGDRVMAAAAKSLGLAPLLFG